MIRLIYGNPGTGKTEYIYSQILDDAKNARQAILIVPEQFTVAAERDVIERIPPSAQLSVEVLNFTRLADKLFRQYGGLFYNFVSRAHEKLLMWQSIKSVIPFLREYQPLSSDDFSLTDAMLSTYKELTASGVSIEQIEDLAKDCVNPVLSSKIKDISLICSTYKMMLGENFTDTNTELSRLSELLKNTSCLNNYNVYIDGFTSFTGIEHNIIREIMRQADNVEITMCIPSPTYNGIDTLSVKDCSDKLRRDCAALGLKTETHKLEINYRARSKTLDMISSDFWVLDKSDELSMPDSESDTVELYKAADIYDECEFAAARIKSLIEKGYRYKDIAIIARNIDKYRGIIEPALDNMGIKYFISEKSDLSTSPIAKFILSAIKAVTHGWRRSDIISHLKTGLTGISAHDADVFECYTAKWNLSGKAFLGDEPWNMNPEGYTTVKTERGAAALEIANRVKDELVGNLKIFTSKLKAAQNYRDMCIATFEYLEALDVRNKMLSLATEYVEVDNLREASDCARMFEIALDSLDCVCDTLSNNSTPDINTFATALKIAFSESDLGSIPTSQDEILCGSANTLRTDSIKCAIILGACDGEFPASTEDSGLFNGNDRKYLLEHGIPISGNAEEGASDELFYFRRASSIPSEKLIVFTRNDAEPSVAFTRLISLLPNGKVTDTSSLLLQRLKSKKAVTEYELLISDTDEGEALRLIIDELDDLKQNRNRVSVSAENDMITQADVKLILGNELSLTQSKAEAYVNCKFAFSCKYLLKLDDNSKAQFSFSNIGTFIHYLLEKFLYKVFVISDNSHPSQEQIQKSIDDIIDEYLSELMPDQSKKTARLLHLIERLKKTSLVIINDLLYEFNDSDFKPEFFEMQIGSREIPSVKITLQDGSKLSLNGKIDRVDVFRKDGKAYIRVVDYKTGAKTFSLKDIKEGLNLQMFLYIISLTKGNKEKMNEIFGGDPIAAGITYLCLDSSKPTATRIGEQTQSGQEVKRLGLILDQDDIIQAVSRSRDDRLLMRSPRKSSFIDQQSFAALFDQVCDVLGDIGEEMLSGNINAVPYKNEDTCNRCKYHSVCRITKTGNR